MTGRVTKIEVAKGFGFIRGAVDGRSYFFHRSALKNAKMDDVSVGAEVTFEDVDGEKGPRAEDVYL
jgi:cold shock protein